MPTLHSSGQKMTDRILGLKFIIVWITDIHGLLISHGREDSSPAWNYPKERVIITKAYPNYEKWVLDQSNLSWFDASVSGNVNKEFLY